MITTPDRNVQIELGRGIGDIVFGMHEAELVRRLGAPDKVAIDGNDSHDLIYHKHQLVLKIEPDDRLGWIEVYNREASWAGIDPWTLPASDLLYLMAVALGEAADVTDFGRVESYFFGAGWVELQYRLGRLDAFNFGVPYDAHDQPVWPVQAGRS